MTMNLTSFNIHDIDRIEITTRGHNGDTDCPAYKALCVTFFSGTEEALSVTAFGHQGNKTLELGDKREER